MTPKISLVAVCCSKPRYSALRSDLLKSRTFSIAITAWSAKVLRSVICLSVNGRTSVRRIIIAPMRLLLVVTASQDSFESLSCWMALSPETRFQFCREVRDVDRLPVD